MTKQLKKGKAKKDKIYVKESKPVISTDGENIIWLFDKIDRSGIYAFDVNRPGKSKHHFLAPGSLSKEAVERLKAKDLEEFSDYIFSFALQNKIRIVGIRNGERFHVLWYDPDHEICPSKKRHT